MIFIVTHFLIMQHIISNDHFIHNVHFVLKLHNQITIVHQNQHKHNANNTEKNKKQDLRCVQVSQWRQLTDVLM